MSQSSSVVSLMEESTKALKWHPSLNVYILDNQDVLLLSAAQQFLLPADKFPFLYCVDGEASVEQIIQVADSQNQQQAALFYYQVNQLRKSGLLVFTEDEARYSRPAFDDVDTESVMECLRLSTACHLVNLSAASHSLLKEIEPVFVDTAKEVALKLSTLKSISFILVDDFLDPRISSLVVEDHFFIISISGENIWISPLYEKGENSLFSNLQKRILDNQPVRKALMTKWPDRSHSYSFKQDTSFSDEHLQQIKTHLMAQSESFDSRSLVIYNKQNKQTDYHPINLDINAVNDFEKQVSFPISLKSCFSRFNQDGGSRSIAAEATVQKLMPLVSPVTGVINHLNDLNTSDENPVKIFRSGFFKTPSKLTSESFDNNSFVQICLGKGVSHQQSKASALSEAIERCNALYQDDVPLMKSTQSSLQASGVRSFNFQDLVPYSSYQYQCFSDDEHPDSKIKQAAKLYENSEIHWLPSWSLTHSEPVHIPLSQCFSNIPFDDDQFGRWHSNGCAAGNTLEEAILQGLFELIERDAASIWWYNRLPRPSFDLSRLDSNNLTKLTESLSPSKEKGHDFWVLDLTMDLGIPVMAGIGKDKETGGWIMGFGCHIIPELAAQRALTELCQLIPIRNQNAAPFDFDAIEEGRFLYPNEDMASHSDIHEPVLDIKEDILTIVNKLGQFGLETLVVDYSRAQIPLKTAKVAVPGLCHIWPQFANERLYSVPVKMGIQEKANTESTLNPQALYI